MKAFVIGICILFSIHTAAQRDCHSTSYRQEQQALDPGLRSRLEAVEQFIQQQSSLRINGNSGPVASAVIRIPVVVHVLYNTASQNISDVQVQSQIEVLNRDFRRNNSDTGLTPLRFRSLAADVQIEFALATADPEGRPTTGIIRKQTNVTSWRADDRIKFSAQGGNNAWDSRLYLNIWVGHSTATLGYATAPGAPADRDGVMIATSVFGTFNTGGAFNMGRTAVHEIGHWLGLRHIWGDTFCGDDGVNDTPTQGNFTPGCPSGFRTTCNNAATGDMYMNFMDYTNDACMNLFTVGQKDRMRALFNEGGPRHLLLGSKGLSAPWNDTPVVVEPPVDEANTGSLFYPNPTSGEITLQLDKKWVGATFYLLQSNGLSHAAFRCTTTTQKLSLHHLKPGVYYLYAQKDGHVLREKLVKL